MQKLFAVFFNCILILSAGAQQEKVLLNEDFNSNKLKWPSGTDTSVSWKLENGRYYREQFKGLSYSTIVPVDLNPNQNYSVSLKTTHISGVNNDAYGIIFGATNNEISFAFAISSNGQFIIHKRENTVLKRIVDWTTATAIEKRDNMENILKVKKEANTWKFYINDILVKSIPAEKLYGYNFGIVSGGKQAIAFDDLVVKQQLDPLTPSGTVHTDIKETVLLKEDFNSNLRNWPIYSDSSTVATLKNGKYSMDNKTDLRFSVCPANINEDQDYSISLSTVHINGVKNQFFGLCFGYENVDNFYAFVINTNGFFSVYQYNFGDYEIVISHTLSEAIRKEDNAVNILTLRQEDGTWRFYINDQFVVSCPSQVYYGDLVGVLVGGKQKIEFDDLLLKHLEITKIYTTKLCLIQKGVLGEIDAEQTIDGQVTAVINGKKEIYRKDSPPDLLGYAAKLPWYVNNEPVLFKGFNFSKYGPIRTFGTTEIKKAGEYKSVGIYLEAGKSAVDSSTIIYIPVRIGCEWQPYAIQCPSIELNTPFSAVPGDTITLSTSISGVKDVKYLWALSQGKIIKGQNTRSIQIIADGTLRSNIDVSLSFSPKPPGCENSKSAIIRLTNKPREGSPTQRQRIRN